MKNVFRFFFLSFFRFPPATRATGACPQVVPFFQRVAIFRQMIDAEKGEHQSNPSFVRASTSRCTMHNSRVLAKHLVGSGVLVRVACFRRTEKSNAVGKNDQK